jgi:hypothetical protein
MSRSGRWPVGGAGTALAVAGLWLASGRALAHGGSLGGAAGRSLSVPLWLFLATGGGVVGASFLLSSFATDRAFIRALHDWREAVPLPGRAALVGAGRSVGVLALAFVLVVCALGPARPLRNAGLLVVWVGWWAGFTMSTYLVGNAWPVLNPWRTLAERLPSLDRAYPERLGAWPAVAGLLGLVWLEVVSPVADDPRLLGAVVAGYTVVTLAGAATVGADAWFGNVDPAARAFRLYGRVAPLGRGDDGSLSLRLPGVGLDGGFLEGADEVAFVVALLWATTFDGLVATAPWATFARAAVGAGVPPVLLYPGALAAGFLVFYGAFRLAVRYGTRAARSYRDPAALAARFAPSLVAIAAGYHLAHYLGYLLTYSLPLARAVVNPLGGGWPATVALPAWFGAVGIAAVVAGHLLAIWLAHAAAYELFPSRLQAIRSQYVLTLVMVFYTMTSLWIVTRPFAPVPFV